MSLRVLPSSRTMSLSKVQWYNEVMYHAELKGLHLYPASKSYSSSIGRPKLFFFEQKLRFGIKSTHKVSCWVLGFGFLLCFALLFFLFFLTVFCPLGLRVWIISASLFSFWDISKCFPDNFPFWCRLCLSFQEFLHYLIGTILLLIGSIVAAARSYNITGLVAGAVRLCLLALILLNFKYIYHLYLCFLTDLPYLCPGWVNDLLAHFSECSVTQCQQKCFVVRCWTHHSW